MTIVRSIQKHAVYGIKMDGPARADVSQKKA